MLPLAVQYREPGASSGHVIDVGQRFVVPLHNTSHLHELAQLTALHAEALPSLPTQFALHSPGPHVSEPHAALPPEHSVRHRPVVQLTLPHALLPWQVASQSPVVQLIVPHAALPPPPEQVASQLPLVHVMLPHAALPVHVTLQSRVLHVMPRHALPAVQPIVHDAALVQLIAPHAPLVPHSMLQFHAFGHVTLPLPVPVIEHVVVWKLQPPLQAAGHSAASRGRASTGRCPITQ